MNTIKKFINNSIVNILASSIGILILQVIAMPVISRNVTNERFGEILILLSIVNILGVVLGNTLNNFRLLKPVENKNIYSLILFYSLMFSSLIWYLIAILFKDISGIILLSLVFLTYLTIFRAYSNVYYRIKLEYKKILIQNFIYGIGLIIGLGIFCLNFYWPIIFLIAEICSVIYLLKSTDFILEIKRFQVGKLHKFTEYMALVLTSLLANVSLYLDRYILILFINPTAVALFFAASVVGKLIGSIIAPINGVVLTYIAREIILLSKRKMIYINICLLIFGFFIACLAYLPSLIITENLYPQFSSNIQPIIFLANLIFIMNSLISVTQSILIKFSTAYNQIKIQFVFLLSYILPCVFLNYSLNIEMFSYILLFSVLIKFFYINYIVIKTNFKVS